MVKKKKFGPYRQLYFVSQTVCNGRDRDLNTNGTHFVEGLLELDGLTKR